MARNDDDHSKQLLIGTTVAVLVVVIVGFFWMREKEARVSGTVTLDGTPLSNAQVVFIGEDEKNQSPVVAQTDEAGQYSLIGVTGGGLPLGKYRATVRKLTLKEGTLPAGEELEKARVEGLLVNTLPKIYEDRSTSTLQFELHRGANAINLELKKQP